VTFTPLKWAYYIFMYWLYVMHELVHRHQNITRSTRSEEHTSELQPRSDLFPYTTLFRSVTFTPLKWAYYIFMYWLYVMHELVHRHQNITRSTDASCRIYRPAAKESENRMLHDEQLYLGEYDEIEAHAHDIALELLALCPDLSFRDAMMKIRRSSHQSLTEQGMTTYPIYRQAFSGVRKHPVMPALHRKIKLWYRQLKQQRHAYDAMGLLCLSQQIIQNHDKV